jgi:hypothetical protein
MFSKKYPSWNFIRFHECNNCFCLLLQPVIKNNKAYSSAVVFHNDEGVIGKQGPDEPAISGLVR